MHDSTVVRPQPGDTTVVYAIAGTDGGSTISHNDQTIVIEHGSRGLTGATGATGTGITVQTFTHPGTLSVYTGKSRFYCPIGFEIGAILVSVGTPPVGSALKVDVNRNGTTIFTTQANRPTITAGAYTDLSNTPDVGTVSAGDYITVDIDEVGSSFAGSDLTVVISLIES